MELWGLKEAQPMHIQDIGATGGGLSFCLTALAPTYKIFKIIILDPKYFSYSFFIVKKCFKNSVY